KASRASPCSRCWSAPNWQVAIFCLASTAKHGPAGKSTTRAAARNAQRDMLNPPNPLKLPIHIKAKNWHQKLAPNAIKSPGTLRHDHFCVNAKASATAPALRQRPTRCPLWVKSGHRSMSASCPLYPRKRTLELSRGMSGLCQKRTKCIAANGSLFDHLVGASDQRRWRREAKCPG